MKTALHKTAPEAGQLLKRTPTERGGYRFVATALCRRAGFKALCIILVLLAFAASSIGAEVGASLPDSPDKSVNQQDLSPTNLFLTAYNSMSMADWLKEKDMRTEAVDLYTEALNLFLKVAADYPQWQPAVVSFRINYCRTTLQHLQGSEERKAEIEEGMQMTPDPASLGELHRAQRQTTEDGGPTPDARRRTPEAGGQAATGKDSLKRTTDDGRQTTDDRLQRTPDARRRTPDDGKQASRNQKSEIRNPKSEISTLSPLDSKLRQAGLKERGRDYTGALAMYIEILEEFPQEPWALKGACRCCLRSGRTDKARTLTRQALALPLPDADLKLLAALVDCYYGRYQTALPLLQQSLKQNGACPEAHAALGVALAATGNMKEAQEEMKRALSLNPKLGDAYYNLARLSLKQKPTDHDTARVHYQNALRHGSVPDPELDKLLAE